MALCIYRCGTVGNNFVWNASLSKRMDYLDTLLFIIVCFFCLFNEPLSLPPIQMERVPMLPFTNLIALTRIMFLMCVRSQALSSVMSISCGKWVKSLREGRTSARIYKENSFSVLSILTMAKQKYEDSKTTITCAIKHANMNNTESPLQVSTSESKQPEFSCD